MKKALQFLFVMSVGFPLMFLVLLSVGENWPFPKVLPEGFSVERWQELIWGNSDLSESLIVSVGLSAVVALTVTLLAFWVSKSIAYSSHKSTWLMLAYVPYLLSPVIMAVIFQYYFIWAGLTGTFFGVAVAQFFIAFPFGVIILSGFWNERIKALEGLSHTLGCSRRQAFVRVLLPVFKNALWLCFFQVFLVSWFEYGLTNLIGVGKIRTLTVAVFSYVNEANIFYAAMACCLLVLPPMLLLYLNKRIMLLR